MKTPITIEAVANGWMVLPSVPEGHPANRSEVHVFQTMDGPDGLLKFITDHFDATPASVCHYCHKAPPGGMYAGKLACHVCMQNLTQNGKL